MNSIVSNLLPLSVFTVVQDVVVKACLLLVAAAVATAVFKNASAAVRHWVLAVAHAVSDTPSAACSEPLCTQPISGSGSL